MGNYKYKFKHEPYDHQREVLAQSWNKKVFALLMDMGTGKSKVLIDTAAINFEVGNINGLLVIAPKGVYKNWPEREIPKHLPDRIETRTAVWKPWSATTKKDKANLTNISYSASSKQLDILVMNIDAFNKKKFREEQSFRVATAFMRSHKTLLAVDESTIVKNPKANRTKAILKLADMAVLRRILTGSPITRDPRDLYAQYQFLDWQILGHKSYYSYLSQYAIQVERQIGRMSTPDLADMVKDTMDEMQKPRGRTFKMVVGFRDVEALYDRIDPYSYRILKEDCLDLPPKQYDFIDVELSKEQKLVYNQMTKDMVAETEDGKFASASIALTQILRLRQITSGHVKWDDGTVELLPNHRIQALKDCLAEFSGKAVVWACFQPDLDAVTEAIEKEYGPESVVTYHGRTPDKERMPNLKRFDEDPECRFLVGNPQTGGMGVEMTSASLVVYFSNSHDLGQRLQSEDRCHRVGQTKSVMYKDIRALGTVDCKLIKCLRDKKNLADEVLHDPIKEWI